MAQSFEKWSTEELQRFVAGTLKNVVFERRDMPEGMKKLKAADLAITELSDRGIETTVREECAYSNTITMANGAGASFR